jgi:hypothetical protein
VDSFAGLTGIVADASPANDDLGDDPAVPEPHVERQLLSGADIQRLSDRHRRMTESGPVAKLQVLVASPEQAAVCSGSLWSCNDPYRHPVLPIRGYMIL